MTRPRAGADGESVGPRRTSGGIDLPVRVRPGASRTHVGGRYGDGELIVAVNAPAVDGAATEAVLRAVARALDVARRDVELVRGERARSKLLRITGSAEVLLLRVQALLAE